MNRLFNTFFDEGGNGSPRRWAPAMDLLEADNQLVLKADLPGLSEEDVRIEVQDNVLRLSGERKAGNEEKGEGFYRVERSYGAFSRAVTLPDGVDADAIDATFDKGVLEVRIPKPEKRQPRRISIGGAEKSDVEGTATEK
jgi:HSP20 family protein